jgi:predicted metalloprotease with PDZ domain
MKVMWTQHGKSEIPYTNDDIERVLGEVTGDRAFAKTFFNQYIHQHDLVDYKDLLAQAGLLLREAYPGKAWIGSLSLSYAPEKTRVTNPTLIGTPIYQSGVDRGDVIHQIDNEAILSEEDLDRIIENHAPGDTVTIKLISRGVDKTAQLIFRVHPGLEVVPFEHADREVTVDIEAFRRQWLETRVPGNGEDLRRYCHTCKRAYPFAQEYCRYDGDPLQLTSKQ